MVFTIKDVLEELALDGEKAAFGVKLREVDTWVLSVIDKLEKHGIEPLKYRGDIEIREKAESYQVIFGARALYFPKKLYNSRTIAEILEKRLFTNVLYQTPCFLRGLVFVFVNKEE